MSTRGRVLVTGATGCVGRPAVSKLVEHGWDVRAVRSKRAASEIAGVTWLQGNLLDPADVQRLVAESQPSHLLHLAWEIAPGKWAEAPGKLDWVRASLNLVTAFKQAGGLRVVSAGSCLEYDWNYGYCSEERTPLSAKTLYGICKHSLQLLTSAMSS